MAFCINDSRPSVNNTLASDAATECPWRISSKPGLWACKYGDAFLYAGLQILRHMGGVHIATFST